MDVGGVEQIVDRMRRAPAGVRFQELVRVCDHYFGEARQGSSSHRVYGTPWRGDPRANIQNKAGSAKPYQVRQVLAAIDRLEQEGTS